VNYIFLHGNHYVAPDKCIDLFNEFIRVNFNGEGERGWFSNNNTETLSSFLKIQEDILYKLRVSIYIRINVYLIFSLFFSQEQP
jgi:hypothetical protein